MKTPLTPVQSSNLQAVGFDEATGNLIVQFKGGNEYSYSGVSREVFDSLMSAKSIGSFYHSRIRNNYAATKIEKQKEENETTKKGEN